MSGMRLIKASRAAWALALTASLSVPSFAAEPVIAGNPAPSPAEIIEAQQVPDGIFEPQSDGSALHVQSGFVCPAALPHANLWQFLIYPWQMGEGTNVGCSYGRIRNGRPEGGAESKFTVFFVKAPPGTELDTVFNAYLDEMRQNFPGGTLRGDVIHANANTLATMPPFRSMGEDIVLGRRAYANELVVGIVGEWVIQIRSTFPTEFVEGDPAAGADLPAAAIFWAINVREFARTAAPAGPN